MERIPDKDSIQSSTVLRDLVWFSFAIMYGFVLLDLLSRPQYTGGIIITVIAVVSFLLIAIGSLERIRKSTYFEAGIGILMIGYSIDSFYRGKEILLSVFLFGLSIYLLRTSLGTFQWPPKETEKKGNNEM